MTGYSTKLSNLPKIGIIGLSRQRGNIRPEDLVNTLDKFIEIEEPEEAVFEKTKLIAQTTIINNQTKKDLGKQIIKTVSSYFPQTILK